MKKVQRLFNIPILLLILGILAFGLQALWLGYFLDDWVFLYHIFRGGYEQLTAYSFGVNRPFGAWPWWVAFSVLGYSPFLWQLWSLALRVLTAIFLWLGWKQIFPERKFEIGLASTLFLVYPIFIQQTASVTFSDHWMCFALYALSVLLMVYSIKHRRLYLPLTLIALAASGLQLFTIEYYVGLELIRPLLLWFLSQDSTELKARIKQVVFYELPYALVLGIFLVWRFFFMPTPGFDRNKPELLANLLHSPLKTAGAFAVEAVQDLVEALLGSWYKTYKPITITLSPISSLLSWGVVIAAFLLALLFFFQQARHNAEPVHERKSSRQWIMINFIVMIAGFLPAWMVGQQLVSGGNYADRFGLAAMFGASLLVVSAASYLLKQRHAIVLICLLIALAAGYHFRLTNEYRWRWEKVSQLAWQLSWRIPGLAPQTSIYGDGAMESGSWVDISWLNFIYSTPSTKATEDYWYYDLKKYQEGDVPQTGQALAEKRFELLSYFGNSSDSLVIQIQSAENQCLWVLTSDDIDNPSLNPLVKEALPLSNLKRITPTAHVNPNMRAVFGQEPVHEWCYYYEKASLAEQEKQWAEVNTLWQKLSAEGLKTGVAVEYLPFINGVARSGDAETALEISRRAKALNIGMQDPICQTWQAVLDDGSLTNDPAQVKQAAIDQLDCGYLLK